MSDKYDTCSRLELGTLPPNITHYLVSCKWIFCTKYLSNSSIGRYNACLIVKRFRQCLWFNHHDILGLVVKLTAIWFIFTLAINYGCSFDNLKSTRPFSRVLSLRISLRISIWLNHQALLVMIIPIIFANFAKLFIVLNKLIRPHIIRCSNFLSLLALPTLIQTPLYLSSTMLGYDLSLGLCWWHCYYRWKWWNCVKFHLTPCPLILPQRPWSINLFS